MSAADPATPVRAFYVALGRGDAATALGLLAPDVAWTEAEGFPYYSGAWRGPDAVRDNLLARLDQDWEGFAAVAEDFITQGDRVVAVGAYTGVYRATGLPMRARFAHVWTVRDEKLTRFDMYADTAKVLEAMRAPI